MTSSTFIPSPKSLPFELRPSSIQGQGGFATRRIHKDTRIIEYIGERISQEEADLRYDDEAMERHHTFLFNLEDDEVLDAGTIHNESRYINHSCDPNCQALMEKNRIFIYALRDIEPGEELVYDYAYDRTEDMDEETEALYVCHCGATNCRGTILSMLTVEEQEAAEAAERPKASSKQAKRDAKKERKAKASGKGKKSPPKGKSKAPARGQKKSSTKAEKRSGSRGRGRRSA